MFIRFLEINQYSRLFPFVCNSIAGITWIRSRKIICSIPKRVARREETLRGAAIRAISNNALLTIAPTALSLPAGVASIELFYLAERETIQTRVARKKLKKKFRGHLILSGLNQNCSSPSRNLTSLKFALALGIYV